ncbi:MAG: hypothetical protein JO022_20875 [Acidobacteriaceae bacterium]|nr:hypothetical protein [Acidobacteriaceae bacterium]
MSFVLLAGAVLLTRSFVNVRWLDPGFESHGVLALDVVLSPFKYNDPEGRAAYFEQAVEQLRGLPGVRGVAFTSALPLVWKGGTNGFAVEGRPRPKDSWR